MNEFYCPLVEFNLHHEVKFIKNALNIIDDIKIIFKKDLPSLSILEDHISINERSFYENRIPFWLSLKKNASEVEEIINIFQLALWIIKPTEFNIRFFSNFDQDCSKQKFRNLLSRFVPIHNHFEFDYNNCDLENLKIFFPIMMDLYKNNARFHDSLVFNIHGCFTKSWETTYILFSTTFESLLNHDVHCCKSLQKQLRWGTKKKLAWAYTILTETENKNRQIAYEDFRDIYKIRSEILHGESYEDKHKYKNINLEKLTKCRKMLRNLWQVILDSEELIEKLSQSDSVRRGYFTNVAKGWMPEEE